MADIARRVGASRRTVYRYRNLTEPPEPKRPHRPPRQRVLTPYEPYLLQRWQEGCHNGMRLYREIRGQGYAYGTSNVMRFVAQLRRDETAGQPAILESLPSLCERVALVRPSPGEEVLALLLASEPGAVGQGEAPEPAHGVVAPLHPR